MANSPSNHQELILTPIGYIHTGMRLKFEAPHQPKHESKERNIIRLIPQRSYDQALKDLDGFEYIWLIWWFNRNSSWKPRVLPPRGEGIKRGLFATRSPHRPNPIGITAVPLYSISKLELEIGASDLLDGTPILDIKPYLRKIDSFPQAAAGWVDQMESRLEAGASYKVKLLKEAEEQMQWLESVWNLSFRERLLEILSRDPTPHRTRRITRFGKERFKIGCGAWRAIFTVERQSVTIERIDRGYPERTLLSTEASNVPDRSAQIEFMKKWPEAKAV